MKVEVTELGPSKRALKIEIPPDEVNRRFTQAYQELNRHVRVPGFRPGKAPVALLEKRYAKAVEDDVVRSLVPDYYERAVRQEGLVPVVVEIPPLERIKIKKDASFSFTATVEIKPKIALRDYRPPNPIALKPDPREVTDEQVDQTLQSLREQQAQLHPAAPDTVVAPGLFVVLDLEGFVDGTAVEGTKKEAELYAVGSKTPVMGLDLDDHLMGKKEGDVVEVQQPYPANHPDERLAGKTVTFRVRLSAVKEKRLPALDDEFAKDCGPYGSLQELKDTVREQLDRVLRRDKEEKHKDFILKRLEETHHFDVPETLVDRELSAIVRGILQRKRRPDQDALESEPLEGRQQEVRKLREEHLPEAKRRVKLGLILEAIADREGLSVTEEDVNAEIARLANDLKLPFEEIQKFVLAGGEESQDELRGRILADKALDFVYRHAVIQG